MRMPRTQRATLLRSLVAVPALFAMTTAAAAQANSTVAVEHASGGFTVAADDGFDLWFDAWGKGPGIIFLARNPNENRAYAEALSDAYRVVIFETREITMYGKAALESMTDSTARMAAEGHLAGRNVAWDPSAHTDYPMDLVIGDLHRIADAAGLDRFVLGGYSGTARLAAFYATHSDRAVGMIIGGFHILGSQEYWIGFNAGSAAAAASNPDTPEITKHLGRLNRMQSMMEHNVDAPSAFGSLAGPKIVWVGSQDGEPDDALMAEYFFGAKIAHRVRSARAEYEKLGFTFFQLSGAGHMAAYAAADKAVPLIRKALVDSGYR